MSTTSIVFMFSGQGSQYYQMGRALYAEQPTFRRWFNRLNVTTRELSGTSVVEALYERGHDKAELFDRTLLTHPALFMLEYALARTLIEARVEPDIVLGASLGTFAAASIAGCLDVEEALDATIRHARALESVCEAGAMIAILAPLELFEGAGLHRYGELAALNFTGNFVVAVRGQDVPTVERILRNEGVGFRRLPVSFAFHSRWIDPAAAAFERHPGSALRRACRVPLMCSARSRVLHDLSERDLWAATRDPIRFHDTIGRLEANGPHLYVDMDPAGTLATFTKYILASTRSASTAYAVLSPFGQDMERLAKVTQELLARRRLSSPSGAK